MKKLLVALALLTVSTVGYTKEVISTDKHIYIVDGKKVYYCDDKECWLVSRDYTKPKYWTGLGEPKIRE